MSYLTSQHSTSTNTSTAIITWNNTIDGEWDNVTVACSPSCSSVVVIKPANTAIVSTLTPGLTYSFYTVVSSNGVTSELVETRHSLTIGMSFVVREISWFLKATLLYFTSYVVLSDIKCKVKFECCYIMVLVLNMKFIEFIREC